MPLPCDGPPSGRQRCRRFNQIVEFAAKTSPGYFAYGETLVPEGLGVDEVVRLIVRDQPDLQTLVHVVPGKAGDGRRLACPQKAADHGESNGFHQNELGLRG